MSDDNTIKFQIEDRFVDAIRELGDAEWLEYGDNEYQRGFAEDVYEAATHLTAALGVALGNLPIRPKRCLTCGELLARNAGPSLPYTADVYHDGNSFPSGHKADES